MQSDSVCQLSPVISVMVVPCPWCGERCQYVEVDDICPIRIGSICDSHSEAFEDDSRNDSTGNDYGRGSWELNLYDAIQSYNGRVLAGLKTNQLGVW